VTEQTRAAAAGAGAALAWAALEPLDRRVFGCDYSDVAVLGKLVTRGRGWPLAGIALHTLNGTLFGLAYDEVLRRTRLPPRRLALGMALAEHAIPPLLRNGRAFAQATVRHAVFGLLLGRLAGSGRS
jgi:hypothetical protein